MKETKPSFLRGVFAGAIHDSLLFPYPDSLEQRNPDEAKVVDRLVRTLRTMVGDGLIDPARIDEDENVPDEVLRAMGCHVWHESSELFPGEVDTIVEGGTLRGVEVGTHRTRRARSASAP
mgnify:CR=1 FL=1